MIVTAVKLLNLNRTLPGTYTGYTRNAHKIAYSEKKEEKEKEKRNSTVKPPINSFKHASGVFMQS